MFSNDLPPSASGIQTQLQSITNALNSMNTNNNNNNTTTITNNNYNKINDSNKINEIEKAVDRSLFQYKENLQTKLQTEMVAPRNVDYTATSPRMPTYNEISGKPTPEKHSTAILLIYI